MMGHAMEGGPDVERDVWDVLDSCKQWIVELIKGRRARRFRVWRHNRFLGRLSGGQADADWP